MLFDAESVAMMLPDTHVERPIGSICTADRCVSGCRIDRDCNSGDVCVEGQCTVGCANDDECALGTSCVDRVCAFGCNGNDERCGGGSVCQGDVCVTSCSAQDPCGGGQACLDGACVAGCLTNDDCPFLAGVCVGASATSTGVCTAQCAGTFCAPGTQCDAATNACVDCLADDDCDANESCDLTTKQCRPDVPLCAPCGGEQDDAVCGEGGLCVTRTIVDARFNDTESACGIDCSAGQACPSPFTCELVVRRGVAVGAQCVPQSSVIDRAQTADFVELMTCAGVVDARDAQPCQQDNECGDGRLLDGFCVDGVCSLRCSSDADCLAGDACTPLVGRDGSACQ